MSISKLPARPSLESLRKQAKKLAREIAAGDPGAIARVRRQLPNAELPLSLRDAQLVLAREYGFPGWKELVREAEERLGRGLEWAVAEARRIIHDNDVEGLRQLLRDYPALPSWKSDENAGGLLGMATGSYGDSGDPIAEEHFTRLNCAELLLDAGAAVAPAVCDGIIRSRARGLMDLFQRRGLLPRSLKFLAALGDVEGTRAHLEEGSVDPGAASEAFRYACSLQHADVAGLLLDRCIVLDAEVGKRIDGGPGRAAFVQYFLANRPDTGEADGLWQTYTKQHVVQAMRDGDVTAFVDLLRRERWMRAEGAVAFQAALIETAILGWTGTKSTRDYGVFIRAMFDLDPAILHSRVPPRSAAMEFAFTYAKAHLLPLLLRIWPMPDDLPHAAGNGDLPGVKRWFDAEGKFAPGDLVKHFPANDAQYRGDLRAWFGRDANEQDVLDTALGWAVLNNQFDAADFLLAHGANIDTHWSSHEPASILHELVWHENYEAMRFLINRGIDMTILDFRWNATAEGWARHAAHDEKMAGWLREEREKRGR